MSETKLVIKDRTYYLDENSSYVSIAYDLNRYPDKEIRIVYKTYDAFLKINSCIDYFTKIENIKKLQYVSNELLTKEKINELKNNPKYKKFSISAYESLKRSGYR